MIDTHAHLNFSAFEDDRDAVIRRAQKAHIDKIIVVGSQCDSSQRAAELAQRYDMLYAAVGVHPHHADKITPNWFSSLSALSDSRRIVAIGEIGLDYYAYASNGIVDKAVQKQILREQLTLAKQHALPVIIHCREAFDDVLPIVAQYGTGRGVFHCWSGNLAHARSVLTLGYHISFAGNLTYRAPRSPELVEGRSEIPRGLTSIQHVAQTIPLDRILLETDCPFLAPQDKRGLRNEPAFVTITGAFLASLRNVSFATIDRVTSKNAQRVFNLPN